MPYFSPSKNAFFSDGNPSKPEDAKLISQDEYERALQDQSTGKVILGLDGSGKILTDYPSLSENEQEKTVRTTRDRLLAESDWTQLPDAPVDGAAWSAYRQLLRDIPSQEGFPADVLWPSPPE